MPEFPTSPIPPAEFLETFLPAAFAETRAPEAAQALAVELGVALEGDGGGEWVLEIRDGQVNVRPGSRSAAAFSYVQSVADWRGALWEGRGGVVGRAAAALFRPGLLETRAPAGFDAAALPATLDALRSLEGLLRLVVTIPDESPWQVDLKLGPGEIPREPTTAVSVSAADAHHLAAGELKILDAFLSGRIRVTGDMTLMLQMQAAQMQASRANSRGQG